MIVQEHLDASAFPDGCVVQDIQGLILKEFRSNWLSVCFLSFV